MSSTLSYEISQTEFKREAVESVRKTFGLELGTGYVYRVSASFKTDIDRKGIWCNPQMVQKQDRKEQEEEVYGTISNEEWNKMVEETLRKDKKLLEKLAKI